MPAAKVTEIPDGTVKVVQPGGRELVVANVGGEFYAIDDVCTHDGGPLGEGMLFDTQIECPRHGALFDLKTGRPTVLPAVLPVRTYPTRVEGDTVLVDV